MPTTEQVEHSKIKPVTLKYWFTKAKPFAPFIAFLKCQKLSYFVPHTTVSVSLTPYRYEILGTYFVQSTPPIRCCTPRVAFW